MTDYEEVKADITEFDRLYHGTDEDTTLAEYEFYVGNDEAVDVLWRFVRQLQEIIEAANTEPPDNWIRPLEVR